MLPWDLEDWLTDVGAQVLDKRLLRSSLTPLEELTYQIWLLDTEARNGGLSQYFCNHGSKQWQECEASAKSERLSSFEPFSKALNCIIGGTVDPYSTIRAHGDAAEDLWFIYQSTIVQELKALFQHTH